MWHIVSYSTEAAWTQHRRRGNNSFVWQLTSNPAAFSVQRVILLTVCRHARLFWGGNGWGWGLLLSLNHTVANSPIKKTKWKFLQVVGAVGALKRWKSREILKSPFSNCSNRSRWGELHRVCFDQAIGNIVLLSESYNYLKTHDYSKSRCYS